MSECSKRKEINKFYLYKFNKKSEFAFLRCRIGAANVITFIKFFKYN